MNELEFSYDDYLHNITKSCDKMDSFDETGLIHLDDNCLDHTSSFNKFVIEDASIDNLNLSSSLSNTLSMSNTISSTISSSSIHNFNDYSIHRNDLNNNLDLTQQLQKAKSSPIKTNCNFSEINHATSKVTKVPVKKVRKIGVNHKFVNNPNTKHLKKIPKLDFQNQQPPFPLKLFKASDLHKSSSTFTNDPESFLKNDLFKSYSQSSSAGSSKGMGCGKPGYITCSICNATKYYSHVQRRFGQFSCEPCSKFMKKFLKDPKIYYCVANGECQIGKPTGEQEPRGVSVNRCKACWLKICLNKFVLDDDTRKVINSHYAPRLQRTDSINSLGDFRFNEERLISTNLPPLPLLNTRKRKSNDDALIEDDLKSNKSELKSKKKNKDLNDQSKIDKRERKRKLIYSPPSTPKRSKKRSKDDQTDSDDLSRLNRRYLESEFMDDLDEDIDTNNLSITSSELNKNETTTTASFCSTQCICEMSDGEKCPTCCLEEDKDLSSALLVLPESSKTIDFSPQSCVVDNNSELNYELSNKEDNLKESFYSSIPLYNSTPTKSEEPEVRKYVKYEKTKRKEPKFKSVSKKAKKRKEMLASNNLMKKSMKKNFNYIFDIDTAFIYEIINAHSPFL